MSEEKRLKELAKLNFEGKITDLARTRRQQQTSTPIKKEPSETNNSIVSLNESSEIFQSFSTDDTIVPSEEDLPGFTEELVNLSIETVFEKVKINKNKMALSLDKMISILPTYNGSSKDLTSFLRVADLVFARIPAGDITSEPVFLEVVLSKLIGEAQFLYKNGASFKTWVLLKGELKKQFTKKLRTIDVERTLSQMTHKQNESVHDFSIRLKEIWYLLGETLTDITDEVILKHYKQDFETKIIDSFKNSLREPLRSWVKSRTFATFVEAVEFAEKEENMAYRTTPNVLGNETVNHNRDVNNITRQMGNTSIRTRPIICYNCNKPGHVASKCFVGQRQQDQTPMYRHQNFNNGYNPNFNRNMPEQYGQRNQPRFNNNNYTQNSKNYVGGQTNHLRRIRTTRNEQSDMPIYYSQ